MWYKSYISKNNLVFLTAGHGGGHKVPKCSEVKLDAITTDDTGKTYFFAGKGLFGSVNLSVGSR